MKHPGHIGVALIVYAPVAYGLSVVGHTDFLLIGAIGMIAFAMIPDLDLRLPFVPHRGPTHSIGFAVGFGTVFALGTSWIVDVLVRSSIELPLSFGFAIGFLSVCSHLLADLLTPMGIAPLWPVSGHRYSAGLFFASNPIANYGLLCLGIVSIAGSLWMAGTLTG